MLLQRSLKLKARVLCHRREWHPRKTFTEAVNSQSALSIQLETGDEQQRMQGILFDHRLNGRLCLDALALILVADYHRSLQGPEHVAHFVLDGLGKGGPFGFDCPFGDVADVRLQVGESLVVVACVAVVGVLSFRRHGECGYRSDV